MSETKAETGAKGETPGAVLNETFRCNGCRAEFDAEHFTDEGIQMMREGKHIDCYKVACNGSVEIVQERVCLDVKTGYTFQVYIEQVEENDGESQTKRFNIGLVGKKDSVEEWGEANLYPAICKMLKQYIKEVGPSYVEKEFGTYEDTILCQEEQ